MNGYPSYHDVEVIIDGKSYKISEDYTYQLTCTRSGGWNLWHILQSESKLIGGEYTLNDFTIKIKGTVICHNSPRREDILKLIQMGYKNE